LSIKISDGEWRLGIGLQKKLFTLHVFGQARNTVTKNKQKLISVFLGGETLDVFSKDIFVMGLHYRKNKKISNGPSLSLGWGSRQSR
jgi:hypothetical protein